MGMDSAEKQMLLLGDGLLLPLICDPLALGSGLSSRQKPSTGAPGSSSVIPPSPSLKAFHPSQRL